MNVGGGGLGRNDYLKHNIMEDIKNIDRSYENDYSAVLDVNLFIMNQFNSGQITLIPVLISS